MYPTMFFIYLIYGTPTFILYLRAIYVICKQRKKFSSTFYTLYTNLLMVDVLTYIINYPGVKCKEIPELAPLYVGIEISFPPFRIIRWFMNVVFHQQFLSTILIHANRFTAIWFPWEYQKFWKAIIWPAIIIIHIFSLFAALPFYFITNSFIFVNETVSRNPAVVQDFAYAFDSLAISSKVYIIIGGILNILSFLKLMQRNANVAAGSHVHEVSLFVIGVCSFLVQGICALVVDTVVNNTLKPDRTLANVITALNGDCMAFTEVYIGIACNQQLRRAILGRLRISWQTTQETVVTHSGGGGSGQHKNSHHTNMLRSNSTPLAERIDRRVP